MIRREITLLLVAIQFLTRIPVPSFTHFEPDWLDRSTKYFPLVGAIVGGLSAAALLAAAQFWPQPIPALIGIAAGVILTGAFHEDGLADTADGLGGGATRQQRLEIMKDSRIGTYGGLALMLVLALKVAALACIEPVQAAAALVATHAAARLAPVAMIRFSRYAGDAEAAKVKPLSTGIGPGEALLAIGIAIAVTAMVLPPATAVAGFAVAGAAAAIIALQCHRLIGGYTGDNLGAMEQAAETGFVLAVAAMLR